MTPDHEWAIRAAVDELVGALLAAITEAAAVGGAPDRLLDIESASAILGIGRSRLYDEISAGRLRSIRVGVSKRGVLKSGPIRTQSRWL